MYFLKGQSVAYRLSPIPGFGFAVGTLIRVLPTKRVQTVYNREKKKTSYFRTEVVEVKTPTGESRYIDARCIKPVSLVPVSI
jgi:hypothetical protein